MLSALRRKRAARSASAASAPYHHYYEVTSEPAATSLPTPPASPVQASAPFGADYYSDADAYYTAERRNSIADEIATLMTKRFTVEKNLARTSMYKHFTDDSLYHGVNLNVPSTSTSASAPAANDRDCTCTDLDIFSSDSELQHPNATVKYPFTHRNLSLSFEDKENLENEAMEVYTNIGYETSF